MKKHAVPKYVVRHLRTRYCFQTKSTNGGTVREGDMIKSQSVEEDYGVETGKGKQTSVRTSQTKEMKNHVLPERCFFFCDSCNNFEINCTNQQARLELNVGLVQPLGTCADLDRLRSRNNHRIVERIGAWHSSVHWIRALANLAKQLAWNESMT